MSDKELAPLAEPAVDPDNPPSESDLYDEALAVFEDAEPVADPSPPIAEPTPAEPAAAEPPAAPAEEPAAEPEPSTMEKLRVKAAAEAEKRASASPAPTPAPDAPSGNADFESRMEFERDPVGWFERRGLDPAPAYKRMTDQALDRTGTQATDDIAGLKEQLATETAAREASEEEGRGRRVREEQAEVGRRARDQFVRITEDKEKFPLSSRLSPERRSAQGVKISRDLASEGIRFDSVDEEVQTVAVLLEEQFTELRTLFAPEPGSEPEPAGQDPTPSSSSQGRTLTNAHESESVSAPDLDDEEANFRAAEAEAEKMWAGT